MTFISRLILIFLGLLLPCLLFEAGTRIEGYLRKGTPVFLNPSSKWDKELGWVGKEQVIQNEKKDKPVLVIGDSFTEGLSVPGEAMWFSELKKVSKGQSIIAYGGLGYGTLQELLVLRKYLKGGMKPSLIVLQICSNDIINNSYKLERESFLQRAPGPRPYKEEGKAVIRFPRTYDWLLYPLISVSRVASHYNMKWEMRYADLVKNGEVHTVEWDIKRDGFGLPAFREAVSVTQDLFQEFKNEAGEVPLYFLLVDDIEPYTSALKTSTEKLKIPLVIAPRYVEFKAEEKLEDGAHLNAAGNRLLGDILIKKILN